MNLAQALLFFAYLLTSALTGHFLREKAYGPGFSTLAVTLILMSLDFYLTFTSKK